MQKIAHIILKKMRIQYGYTQKEVAQWINSERSNYSRKETGKTAITADEFLHIISELHQRGPKKKSYPQTFLDFLSEFLN